MNNYSEQIFQSIDTIISQRLNEVKFDRTITCEVIAGVKDYPNKYWVSDGATKFQACVADSSRTYTEKQKVYVLIPNGDYNSTDKVIIGSYTANELPKNLYTNPFDHLVYSSKYKVGLNEEGLKILANDAEKDYESAILSSVKFEYSNATPFDYVGLEFSFNTTDLDGLTQGNYGLRIILKHIEKNKEPEEIANFVIDSSQLYGDIYNLNSLIKFQQLFPIPTSANIVNTNNIEIQLYQRKNFDTEETNKYIYLKSAILYFGYDVEKIDSNKLTLYFDKTQSLTFNKRDNVKTLYLEWEDTDLKKIYSFNQEQPSSEKYKYTTYWCKYVPGYKKNKDEGDIEETGVYWKTIGIENSFIQVVDLDSQNNTQRFKVGIKYRNQEEAQKLIDQQTKEKKAVIQDTSLTNEEKQKKITEIEEKYKKLIDALWKYLESNVLIFTNEDVKPEPGSTNNSEDSIKLTCSDSGVYNYYTSYGKIIDSKYKNLERTITASFLDGYDIADTTTNVKWSIVGIDETNQKSTMINQKTATNNLFTFTIKDNYIPGIKDQNTILCEATLSNGEIRRGKITLRFGEANSAGSQYAFNIDFPDNVNCLYIGDTTPIEIKYTFESRSGEKIEEPTIIWSWLDDTDHGDIILNANAGTLIAPSIMPTQNHAVLVATIEDYPLNNGLQADLKAYLPIPLSADRNKYQYMSGPTYLVYDSTGSAVLNYSKENYVLYPTDDSETWRAEDYTPNTPQLSFKKGKWYLQPLALAPNNLPVTCLRAIKDPARDNTIIWSQPIFSTRERWDMDALNDWNGTFLQDTEKNRLFAATIAAGGKTEDNTFSGVLMGQSLNPINKALEETGLYGIDKGIVKYYLNNAGAFFVGDGNNYISFNDINKGTKDTNGNATFAVNVNKLLLNTPQTKIISSKPTDRELNLLNINDQLRVKLGWIKDNIYGLDIYNGAFRMYGGSWNKNLTDEDAAIYFDSNNMYVNGLISRSATNEEIYQYDYNLDGEDIQSVYIYNNTSTLLGEQVLNINIDSNNAVSENWFSGISLKTIFKNTNKDSLPTNTYLGITGGRSEGYLTSESMPPPFLMFTTGTKNIRQFIATTSSTSGDSYNAVILASSIKQSLNISIWGTPNNAKHAGTLSVFAQRKGTSYFTGVRIGGTIFTDDTTSDARRKHSIEPIEKQYEIFFDNLLPKRYKYINGTSNRYHTGFIAQEVLSSLEKAGLTSQEFAGIMLLQPAPGEEECYHLRKDEFIALNTWQIQKLKQRVTELENEIKEIKQNENN